MPAAPAPSVVALAACPDYDRERVRAAVHAVLDLLGPRALPEPRETGGKPLLLKPNMLRPSAPARGVTTHPAVFSAAARCLAERGFKLAFGDSPNGLFSPRAAAQASGLLAEAEALGIPQADFQQGADLSYPPGVRNRRFVVARAVLEAAGIVNLPRLKTHGLTTMTGALKNMFGVIPGGRKSQYHITHPDGESFSGMIADLNGAVRSRLVLMDAITVMEGNGPSSGRLRPVGLVIASTDPVAADAVGCRIMGIDPLSVAHVRLAEEAGLGNAHSGMIDILGEKLEGFVCRDFDLRAWQPGRNVPRFLMRWGKSLSVSRPVIDAAVCIRCGECAQACPTTPPSLVQRDFDVPRYAYATCIRCFCCQETCAQGAIRIRRAPLSRLFENRR